MADQSGPRPQHMLIQDLTDALTVQNDLLRQLIGQAPPDDEPVPGPVLVTEPAPPPPAGRGGPRKTRKGS